MKKILLCINLLQTAYFVAKYSEYESIPPFLEQKTLICSDLSVTNSFHTGPNIHSKDYRERAIKYKDVGHTFMELKETFEIPPVTYYDWKEKAKMDTMRTRGKLNEDV